MGLAIDQFGYWVRGNRGWDDRDRAFDQVAAVLVDLLHALHGDLALGVQQRFGRGANVAAHTRFDTAHFLVDRHLDFGQAIQIHLLDLTEHCIADLHVNVLLLLHDCFQFRFSNTVLAQALTLADTTSGSGSASIWWILRVVL